MEDKSLENGVKHLEESITNILKNKTNLAEDEIDAKKE